MENDFNYPTELFAQAAISLEMQGYCLTMLGVGILKDAVTFWVSDGLVPVTYGEFWKNLENLVGFMIDEIVHGKGV
jgi:hypothetical protein